MSMQGGVPHERVVDGWTRVLWMMGSVAGCLVANAVSFGVALFATDEIATAGADYSGYAILIIAVPAVLLLPEILAAIVVCCLSKTCPIVWLTLWLAAVLVTFDLGLLVTWKPN